MAHPPLPTSGTFEGFPVETREVLGVPCAHLPKAEGSGGKIEWAPTAERLEGQRSRSQGENKPGAHTKG